MKRFLKNVLAVLKKSNESKPAVRTERPGPTPLLEVRSQVKAGSWSISANGGTH
jgi:hypothetical protein